MNHEPGLSQQERADIYALRRELHQYPELSAHEHETAKRLRAFALRHGAKNLIEGLGGTGLAVCFPGAAPGPTVLLRAELDALPIDEDQTLSYASRNPGVSHKCGHDGHAAQLAALVPRFATRPPQRGRVILLFQPAEETGDGALAVVADPRFTQIQPDYAFALHNVPGYPLGQVLVRSGAFNCASEGLIAQLSGRTAHAAEPELGLSPARAMCELIARWQDLDKPGRPRQRLTLVHARLGEIAFGTAPSEAWVMATLRTETDAAMAGLRSKAQARAQEIAQEHGLQLKLKSQDRFAACSNHCEAVAIIEQAARRQKLDLNTLAEPWSWSEDFGSLAATCKGAMFGLGAGLDQPGLHDANYDYPEALIETAAQLLENCARLLTE